MEVVSIHDRTILERYLLRDPEVNTLCIGDLDDFFWPYTTWYGTCEQQELDHLALLYSGAGMPVLLCFDPPQEKNTSKFIRDLFRLLPAEVYTHFRPGLETVFEEAYTLQPHGLHYKMSLREPERLGQWDSEHVKRLDARDLDALEQLYAAAYPGNFFDPRMLDTGQYYGIYDDECLIAAAGIHVFSKRYQVASIGNVTTLPAYRGKGLAKQVCARLALELSQHVRHISLNVKADNVPAITTYRSLGFEVMAEYGEFEMRRK